MNTIKISLKNTWDKVKSFLNGEDHYRGIFHLNKEEVGPLRQNYNVTQKFTMLVNKYGGGAVTVPTQQYKITHKDNTPLAQEDIVQVENYLKNLRLGHVDPSRMPQLNR